jgi:hypothetical protein
MSNSYPATDKLQLPSKDISSPPSQNSSDTPEVFSSKNNYAKCPHNLTKEEAKLTVIHGPSCGLKGGGGDIDNGN